MPDHETTSGHTVPAPDFVAMVTGSLAGESPISVEDAVAAAFRLLGEFTEAGWTTVRTKTLDEAFQEYDPNSGHFTASDPVEEPEPDQVETFNDYMVASGTREGMCSVWRPVVGEIANPVALRLAAWLSVIADPTGREFDRVRAAVLNT